MTPEITLTPEQSIATEHILKHFSQRNKQCFTLGGYAGTGKTTVIKEVIKRLSVEKCEECEGGRVLDATNSTKCPECNGTGSYESQYYTLCTAFTGKAVSVLRRKGLHSSQTLHSLMYHVEITKQGKPEFHKRLSIEPDFIIVDESSMLNTQLYHDLLSFSKPILFVGDPGQLPPVGDNPNVMAKPDITLQQIHRQAALNPIIRFANDLRVGRMWVHGVHSMDDQTALDIRGKDTSMSVLLEVDQVITAYNKKRLELNRLIREAKGFTEPLMVGEKVICLRNDSGKNLFNGLILQVTKIHSTNNPLCYVVDLKDDLNNTWDEIPMLKRSFNGQFNEKVERIPANTCLFDYGYCITCHKSQGSEWDSVCVIEQYAPPNLWEMSRWQYTAATRASKKLIYVR